MDILRWVFASLSVLVCFGAVALQTRSARLGLRVLGRILTLGPFVFSAVAFVAGLVGAFRHVPGSWADLVLVVLMIPYFLLATPALYPLVSVRLSPRIAWTVPAGLIAVSGVVSFFALRATGQTGTGRPLVLFVALGTLVLVGLATWLAAFYRNPRCARKTEAVVPPPAV